jgi:hypothetical protein
VRFEDERQAHKCLGALRRALWKFNLQLNDEKTSVLPSRAIFRDRWEFEHNALVVSDVDFAKQETDIYRMVDLSLRFCAEQRSDKPAIWACTRLSKLKGVERNFLIILDALFRLSLEFPRSTSHVASFVINHQLLCVEAAQNRTLKWIKSMLKLHMPHGHDYEVAWCLVVCGVFKFRVEPEFLPSRDSMPNAVVFSMLGLLHEKGLLALPLSAWPWRAHLKKRGIYSEVWLPFFEAVQTEMDERQENGPGR